MKKTFLIFFILICSFLANGQDIHFSQNNNAPLTLNPALTGAFNADHRIIANYKSQWRSLSKAYMTYGLSYDVGILKGRLNGGILGLGIQFFNDQAGDNKMGQTQANISVAYHLPLDKHNMLAAGIQGGFSQKRIDMANMQWDSQYDPNVTDGYNSSLPSNETMPFKSLNYADISAGMLWSYNSNTSTMSSNDSKKVNVGIALFHVNKPKQTFSDISSKRMYMKLAFHASSFLGFYNTNFSLLPNFVWLMQGPSNEIMLGSLFRYRLNDASKYTNFVSETAIALGVHYRFGDAVIASAQFEWRNFQLAFSYDINTSKLSAATKSAGGMEISLRYLAPLFTQSNKSLF